MAGTSPRKTEIVSLGHPDDFVVSELASQEAGATNPFDMEFPLPVEQLTYRYPRPEDRPNLAEGR
jgi:hypothetical protein